MVVRVPAGRSQLDLRIEPPQQAGEFPLEVSALRTERAHERRAHGRRAHARGGHSLVRATQTVAIVANGFADGPAQALRDWLVGRGADVVEVAHPLTPEQGTEHVVVSGGTARRSRAARGRCRSGPPPRSPSTRSCPLRLPRVDAWFGFNPLACARGLVQRRLGRAERVVLWSVDFVPDRFGRGTPLTRLYDRLDRHCCRRADARVELSEAAREAARPAARPRRRGRTGARRADGRVARPRAHCSRGRPCPPPRRLPRAPRRAPGRCHARRCGRAPRRRRARRDRHRARRRTALRARAAPLGDRVRFHGFVPDHREVEQLLADASLAAAPYLPDPASFTRHADPGKLKAYLAAGLPIVLTDVPPNAGELAAEAGAELVPSEPDALAAAIARAHDDPAAWRGRRTAALAYVRRFDWDVLFEDALAQLGLAV